MAHVDGWSSRQVLGRKRRRLSGGYRKVHVYVDQIGWEGKELWHSKEREREMFFPTKQGMAT